MLSIFELDEGSRLNRSCDDPLVVQVSEFSSSKGLGIIAKAVEIHAFACQSSPGAEVKNGEYFTLTQGPRSKVRRTYRKRLVQFPESHAGTRRHLFDLFDLLISVLLGYCENNNRIFPQPWSINLSNPPSFDFITETHCCLTSQYKPSTWLHQGKIVRCPSPPISRNRRK